jgi:hypothetical protein
VGGLATPKAKWKAKKFEGFALGWPNHPQAKWGGWPPSCGPKGVALQFFFFLKKASQITTKKKRKEKKVWPRVAF